jgi:predicted DNA-binding protein (MmcQ/YjbR family)
MNVRERTAALTEAEEASVARLVSEAKKCEGVLREFALRYPETREDFPWGERVIKVRNKVFVFLGLSDGDFHVTVKLPESSTVALMLPFVEPTGYGLGKSGWVTARFRPAKRPPTELLRQWIDESYRAVAPKRLIARIESMEAGGRPESPRTSRRARPRAR